MIVIDYVVKENNKWNAHIRERYQDGTSKEILSHKFKDMSYSTLKKSLSEYNLTLPPQKSLQLFKKTQYRKCYLVN